MKKFKNNKRVINFKNNKSELKDKNDDDDVFSDAIEKNKSKEKKKASAMTVAGRILSRVDVTEKTLTKKLTDKGFSKDDVGNTVQMMVEIGAVSDDRMAELIVRSAVSRCKGPGWVYFTSLRKGVDKSIVDVEVEKIDWTEVCQSANEKLKKSNKKYDNNVAWRKLMYDGFSGSIIKEVLK